MRIKLPWRRKTGLRHFVLVDEQGVCRALRSASERPASTLWIETRDYHISWLNRPLTQCQNDHP